MIKSKKSSIFAKGLYEGIWIGLAIAFIAHAIHHPQPWYAWVLYSVFICFFGYIQWGRWSNLKIEESIAEGKRQALLSSPDTYLIMPDYESTGIWKINKGEWWGNHQMVGYGQLRLPEYLEKRFQEWISYFDQVDENGRIPDEPLYNSHRLNTLGLELAEALQKLLGERGERANVLCYVQRQYDR